MAVKKEQKKERMALVLGGGAPTLTLMSGAVTAFIEEKIEFDVVSTSGAGIVVGTLMAASKGGDPLEALKKTIDLGVHDSIYNWMPMNFKVFHRSGGAAEKYTQMMQSFFHSPTFNSSFNNFTKDMIQLTSAMMTPLNFNPTKSTGLCQSAPWIEHIVDFEELKNFGPEFFLNAWNLDEGKMYNFDKSEITAEHFRAGLAFPLLYEPHELNGQHYIEGASLDPLNLDSLNVFEQRYREKNNIPKDGRQKSFKSLDKIILLDTLGNEKLLRKPKDLYEAWVQSMIVPLIEASKTQAQLFEYKYDNRDEDDPKKLLHRIRFEDELDPEHWLLAQDWSYSNLERLFHAGYNAAKKFCLANKSWIQSSSTKKQAFKKEATECRVSALSYDGQVA